MVVVLLVGTSTMYTLGKGSPVIKSCAMDKPVERNS